MHAHCDAHTRARTHTHTPACTHTHSLTHTRTQARTDARTYALTHTHTHTFGYVRALQVEHRLHRRSHRAAWPCHRLSVQYGPQLIQSSRTVKLTVSFWNYISYQKYSNLMRKSDLEADRNGIVTGGPRADIKLNRLPPQKLQKSCSSCRN